VVFYKGVTYPKKVNRFAEDDFFKNQCFVCGAGNIEKREITRCGNCKLTLQGHV
jgi:hypothetical protein